MRGSAWANERQNGCSAHSMRARPTSHSSGPSKSCAFCRPLNSHVMHLEARYERSPWNCWLSCFPRLRHPLQYDNLVAIRNGCGPMRTLHVRSRPEPALLPQCRIAQIMSVPDFDAKQSASRAGTPVVCITSLANLGFGKSGLSARKFNF